MTADGTFILADIGGYTPFLTGVGIEHAKEITSHLFNSMLKVNRGRWKVANIEGDCIFLYREGRESASDLLNDIKNLYREFCARTIDIAARASCPCGACTRTNQLTLKFIVHAGEFDVQKIGRRTELIGADVVIAHRLLKNSVSVEEYVLLTHGYAPSGMQEGLPASEGCDECEGVGVVDYVCLDLEPVRKEIEARNHFFLTADQARMRVVLDIDAEPDAVWDALCDREKHLEWSGEREHWEAPGRRGRVGQVHRCVGANGSAFVWVLVALDEADRRRTNKLFVPMAKNIYATQEVTEHPDGGSRLATYIAFDDAIPVVSHLVGPVIRFLGERGLRRGLVRLKAYCERQPQSAASKPD